MQPGRTRGRGRIAEAGLLAFAIACFLALARYHWHHLCDDAFIAFRYTDNLVAGAGPVWNHGEAVEGFSSPLWLALLALGRGLGAALPAWAGAWGIGSALLALGFAYRLAQALSGSRVTAAATVAAGSLLYPLYYWAPAGLETALLVAIVTAAALSLFTTSPSWWALAAAWLGVARPEGPLLVAILGGLAWVAHGRAAARPRLLALALAPLLAWEVFRLLYYGAWLPNTYYAKATGHLLDRLTAGALYALWGLGAWAAAVAALWASGTADRRATAALAFLGAGLAVVVAVGGDWMWHARMLVPFLPALLALSLRGLAAARARRRWGLAVMAALAWSPFLPAQRLMVAAFRGERLPVSAYQEGSLISANLEAARFIAVRYPAELLVAVDHAGALPYALPNPMLDMAGLCDRHLAREVAGGLHHKFDPGYVLSRRPGLIVLNSRTRPGTGGLWYHPGYWMGETALVAHPDFQSLYRPVARFWQWQWQGEGGGGYVLLYERTPAVSGS